MYYHYTESDIKERAKHINSYRQMKDSFCNESFKDLNARVPIEKNYRFGLENRQSKLFGQELMIYEEDIAIDNKGTGKQVLIKTDFALKKAGDDIDVILFEEPENHLSHVNLKKLVTLISESQKGQTFLSTHNSLISTRLELENLIVLSSSGCNQPLYLRSLPKDTSNYFLKAPPANIIEFVLSPKVILIEGPSEYILFDQFYKQVTKSNLNSDGIHVMDVRGLSFKRYLELAKISGSKIAVITDNDGNYNKTCVEKYKEFSSYNNIEIFFDENNNLRTFEKLVYNDNKTLCKNIFGESPENYMLANKTDSALELSKQENLVTPNYIKKAIDWIRE
jgi:predicted ATP-dependent endonuclease of OLD family